RVRRAAGGVAARDAPGAGLGGGPHRRRRIGSYRPRPARGGGGGSGRPAGAQGPASGWSATDARSGRAGRAARGHLVGTRDLGRDGSRPSRRRRPAGTGVRLRPGNRRPSRRRRGRGAAPAPERLARSAPARTPTGIAPALSPRTGTGRRDVAASAGSGGTVDTSYPNPSTALARIVVDELARGGVGRVVAAPGSRSTALALAVAQHPDIDLVVALDERSAAFHALGWAKASGRPAAVVTTSGTAVANLLPAVVEADLSATPLIVLSSDRPSELRGVGANQTIDQVGIFGGSIRFVLDLGPGESHPDAPRWWRSM